MSSATALATDPKVLDTLVWKEVGRCRGASPADFYPDNDEDPGDEAKAICATCPVTEACLEYALVHSEKLGVWGGYTARERRRLVRQKKRTN